MYRHVITREVGRPGTSRSAWRPPWTRASSYRVRPWRRCDPWPRSSVSARPRWPPPTGPCASAASSPAMAAGARACAPAHPCPLTRPTSCPQGRATWPRATPTRPCSPTWARRWAGGPAVVLTPRAQNPTGAAFDQARARDLGAVLGRYAGVLTIEDDHAGAVSGAQAFSLAGAGERWAVVRSTSKWLGPDLRLAVVAADPTNAARVEGRQRLGTGWGHHSLQQLVHTPWS